MNNFSSAGSSDRIKAFNRLSSYPVNLVKNVKNESDHIIKEESRSISSISRSKSSKYIKVSDDENL